MGRLAHGAVQRTVRYMQERNRRRSTLVAMIWHHETRARPKEVPRFHAHFTPTYASWLNQVEIWSNRITKRVIRRGTFRSVKELAETIDQYVRTSNTHGRLFPCTATADSIFTKVQQLCERIDATGD